MSEALLPMRKLAVVAGLVALSFLAAMGAGQPDGAMAAYVPCSCTGYAWFMRPDLPQDLGHARDWAWKAARAGFPVDGKPRVGDIAVFPPGYPGADPTLGHVAYVNAVYSPTSFNVTERNYGAGYGKCSVATRPRPISTSGGVLFIHARLGGPNYNRFVLQTGTALGLDDPSNWEFESGDVNLDGYVDLIGILERGPTGTGRREVHVLNGATNFTTFLLQTGTALGLDDPNNWEFVSGDVNLDGYIDLIGILEKGPTGTGRREVHVLNGATNWTTFLLQTGTPLGLDDPHNWEFVSGDVNRDGHLDLIGVVETGRTGTGRMEVHVLDGATNFTTFLLQTGTPLGLGDPMYWEFKSGDVNRDGYLDLIGVLEKGPTGTGRREVHVLNGATNFTTFLLQTGTALGLDQPYNWEFISGDVNRDGYPDLIGVLEKGPTGTGRREVHAMG